MSTFWYSVVVLSYVVTIVVFIPLALLTKKRHATSTIAWMMAIVVLPFIGPVMFLFFGINRVERRTARKQQASRAISRHLPELTEYQLIPGDATTSQHGQLIRLTNRVAETVPTFGNRVELLADTHETLALIEEAIGSARQTLHLEYYIWQPDRTGRRVRDLLIQKAREGVTVRFLYDAVGSMYLNNRFLKPMRDAGIHVATFLPGTKFRERWSLNLRNHRKTVIVDGSTGFTGGMNIGDEYLGKNPEFGFWRDTHLRLRGPIVLQLQQVFVEDWYYATNEELTQPELFPRPDGDGTLSAQVVSGGPAGDVSVFHSLLFAAINEAREEISLATSYFVPPSSLVAALETASHRGVRIRLLIAGRAAFQWTVWAGRSYYDSLLQAGIEIYEYREGLLHSKTLSIDGTWSLVGTPNFDARSLFLNFEVAVVIYDSKTAMQLEEQFRGDLEHSVKIEPERWSRRTIRQRLGESICRLFAPVL